jgi:hypothetical protein
MTPSSAAPITVELPPLEEVSIILLLESSAKNFVFAAVPADNQLD